MCFCKCKSNLNLLVSCSPHMALAFVGVICFRGHRSMTKDYNRAKEFDASCSCWIFTQKHKADAMLLLPVKYSASNSVITV